MSLDSLTYSTSFTKAARPFFTWCLDVLMDDLDAEARKVVRGAINSRRFHIIVTAHHRPHKLWEAFAKPYPSVGSERYGRSGRVYGATRRTAGHPKRDHIVHVSIPVYTLANPTRLARVFVHEFAHVMQNNMVWRAGRARMIPRGGSWAHDAAEEDAEDTERRFGMALAKRLDLLGPEVTEDAFNDGINDAIEERWRATLAKSPRLRAIVARAQQSIADRKPLW